MPQCFRWVDGTQEPISSHSENSQYYFCYKQFHSLNNKAVSNFRGLFTDNEYRRPGQIPNHLIGDPAYCIKECDHCSNNKVVALIIC